MEKGQGKGENGTEILSFEELISVAINGKIWS
jgi:hypothetical protein